MTNKNERIRVLEQEVESYRIAADEFAGELISIIKPYCSGDAIAMSQALSRVANRHLALGMRLSGKAVH